MNGYQDVNKSRAFILLVSHLAAFGTFARDLVWRVWEQFPKRSSMVLTRAANVVHLLYRLSHLQRSWHADCSSAPSNPDATS